MTGKSIVLSRSVMAAEQERRRDGSLDGLAVVYLEVFLTPWPDNPPQ